MEAILARGGTMELFTAVTFGDWAVAKRLLRDKPDGIEPGSLSAGVLHLSAKRDMSPR
ncbi:MAG: hypothetical protein ABI647_19600 [Gemmatimonadota bacterium]